MRRALAAIVPLALLGVTGVTIANTEDDTRGDVSFSGQRLETSATTIKARKHRRVKGRLPTAGSWNYHSGYPWAIYAVDITIPGSADCGNPVGAHRPGRVVAVFHWGFSYGTHVVIRGPLGRYRYYAHLSKERVRVGKWVRKGQMIGRVGTTGNSTGCHLHYEVRPGFSSAASILARPAVHITLGPKHQKGRWRGLPARPPWTVWWRKVARCESSLRWHINTGNGYYGGLQFYLPTWLGYGGRQFSFWPHRATAREQKRVAERVLRGQGIHAWPNCGPPAVK